MESSEGVQVEYLAVFIAVMFPGALVAFNHESLQALQRISALRIYCAGIWHNAMVGCSLYVKFILQYVVVFCFICCPFHIHVHI